MRGRVARSAFALGSAGIIVAALAGCNQSTPEEDSAGGGQSDLMFVVLVQVDESGAEV